MHLSFRDLTSAVCSFAGRLAVQLFFVLVTAEGGV